MFIGSHVSAATALALAPERARQEGCECFQFFSRSPRGGAARAITPEVVKNFGNACREFGQCHTYIHGPYYINLASPDEKIRSYSMDLVRSELQRGNLLGVNAMMFHPGSTRDSGEAEGLQLAIEALREIVKGYRGKTQLLVEISAGAGAIIGDTFEEIAALVHDKKVAKHNVGVCFDTAHAFASGYDLRDKKCVARTFRQFDRIVGLDKLALIHANDSKADFNSHRDRHEHIGDGKIGMAGFEAVMAFAKKRDIDLIVETPKDGKDIEDIRRLKQMRDSAPA